MSGVVPVEIIENIFSRLSTKSLLRFCSVSKQWFSIISDPIFIQSHLKHVLSDKYDCQQQHKLLITCLFSSKFYSVDYESVDCNQSKLKNLPFSAPHGVTVLGSCNGLLCMGIHNDNGHYNAIIIWNPLFKNYKSVSFVTVGLEMVSLNIGFGYDSLTDDYKLVKFHYTGHKVDVYSTKTNSWRSFLPESHLYKVIWVDGVGTFFNGFLYWFVHVENEIYYNIFHEMLLEFDLKNEKFRFVKLPFLRLGETRLIVVKGCLSIFSWNENFEYAYLSMMNEDNCNVVSWTDSNIRLPRIGEPICLKMNDEIVMTVMMKLVEKKDGSVHEATTTSNSGMQRDGLIIYNPHDGTVKNGPIVVAFDSADCTIYMETLVSLS